MEGPDIRRQGLDGCQCLADGVFAQVIAGPQGIFECGFEGGLGLHAPNYTPAARQYNLGMPFYTRKGDGGYTGLLGEGRVPKNHPRPEAVGAVDEATSALGLARASCQAPQIAPLILEIQRHLYLLMAALAATPEEAERFRAIDAAKVTWLETQIDELSQLVSMPDEFILPADSAGGAALDLARTVVRRAERRAAGLYHMGEISNSEVLNYLNRLSSLCFVLELLENQHAGRDTTLAKDGGKR